VLRHWAHTMAATWFHITSLVSTSESAVGN
jgi:hypothetical protein